eukprot:11448269-Prorocentrum_lima.AAC.1
MSLDYQSFGDLLCTGGGRLRVLAYVLYQTRRAVEERCPGQPVSLPGGGQDPRNNEDFLSMGSRNP